MIRFSHKGSFDKSESFMRAAKRKNYRSILERYANQGLVALRSATPQDSGLTAESWGYEIVQTGAGFKIHWTNSNMKDGIPIAILLQYGHGTRSGTFVQARDFINPAMKPLFQTIAENIWKEVITL